MAKKSGGKRHPASVTASESGSVPASKANKGSGLTRRDFQGEETILIVLFLTISSTYFMSSYGLFGSNAGSHYALTKALVENQSFKVNSFAHYTGFIDYAVYEDNAYSDRAPGMAFAATPFYVLGKALSTIAPSPSYGRGWDAGNSSAFTSLMLPIICGSAAVALLYLIGRELGVRPPAAFTASLTLGLGTILWKHSTMFFSHSLSAFLLLLSVYLALKIKDLGKEKRLSCILFFALGYMIAVEYANAILSLLVLAYLYAEKKLTPDSLKANTQAIACFAVPLLLVGFYNYVNFGDPTTTAYKYSPHHPWVADLSEALSTPLSEGLPAMLFTGENVHGGLFFTTPVLLLSVWGFVLMYRRRPRESILFAAMFLAHLIFYSKYKTYGGGAISDTRYLVTVTPLLVFPLAYWVNDFLGARKSRLENLFWHLVVGALFTMSVLNVAADVATEEGHNTREFVYPILSLKDADVNFDNLFANASRLPAHLGVLALVYAAATAALGRLPGFTKAYTQRTGSLNTVVVVFLVAGVIAFYVTPSISGAGYVNVSRFSYSTDGFNWAQLAPPYNVDSDELYVKSVFEYSGDVTPEIGVMAQDCITDIYINGQRLPVTENCMDCMHCKGMTLPLQGIVQPGQTEIWFKVRSLSGTTRFLAQTL